MGLTFGLFGLIIGLFLLASPIIAIVAIVQWAANKGRGGGAGSFSDGYKKGVHDSFDFVRGIEGQITKEQLNVLESSLVKAPE